MVLEIKQSLKLSQQLVITPQLQQAIKLLQLSQPELVEMVEKEMTENPLLEEETPSIDNNSQDKLSQNSEDTNHSASEGTEKQQEVGGDEGEFRQEPSDFDWENYMNSYSSPEMGSGGLNHDELPSYESTLANKTSLFDHLMWQLQLSNVSPAEMEIGTQILGGINDDGYFRESLQEIAQKCGQSEELAEDVLSIIQDFDPPGVAARNLQECLIAQLKHMGESRVLLKKIILNYLPQLEKRDYYRISKELKISIERVVQLTKLIHELEPKPGREFSSNETHYIVPDVYARKVGHEWVVFLNEDGLPKLKVNALYKAMIQDKTKASTKEYVQDKLKSALWLIRSIHQRQRTLYKTSKTIVKFQRDFFEKGINFLKPMILRDVAQEIEMHESTVSRVTTNKYMHTPHGIFELKFFFNSGVATGQGESIASESIKNKIKFLISQENPKKPFSDQEIVRQLQSKNIDIARRTVAKYRETMGILPSSKRRQLY